MACEIGCHGLLDGYYGIAPRARLVIGKIMTTTAIDPRDIAQAIRWGVLHHVAIESLSMEQPFPASEEQDAIDFATAHGVFIVAAAGNNSRYNNHQETLS